LKNTIWPNHATLGHKNRKLRGGGCESAQRLMIFKDLTQFKHISTKTQPKKLKLVHY